VDAFPARIFSKISLKILLHILARIAPNFTFESGTFDENGQGRLSVQLRCSCPQQVGLCLIAKVIDAVGGANRFAIV
jgi:hypothetical protein